jgi:hypothetical protein
MSKFLLTVCAVFGLLLSSASAQEDDAKNEAWRTEGLQKLEFTRFVSSGKKITLDFAYALNPDCSPSEGGPVEVKTTTEPAHGTVEVVPGDRFPVYAKTNIRFKCNDKKTRGLIINYKSTGGYIGSDTFEVLILYPSGLAREVHYNLNVR